VTGREEEEPDMGKARARAVPADRDQGDGSVTVSVRVSRPYFVWLEGMMDRQRLRLGDLVDHALADYANRVGCSPPPRRC
jgi:hypothetical protein